MPRKPLNYLRVLGMGQLSMAAIFFGSVCTPPLVTTWPKYSTIDWKNWYLVNLEKKLLGKKAFQYALKVFQVFSFRLTINQNVIKKNDDKALQIRSENLVHGCLKLWGSVQQAKRHDDKLIVAVISVKCFCEYHTHPSWFGDNLLVNPTSKTVLLPQFIQQFVDGRNGKTVTYG